MNGAAPNPGVQGTLRPIHPPPQTSPQEMSIQQLTNYRRSIMNLSDGGKLYRKELEVVLCSEPPL